MCEEGFATIADTQVKLQNGEYIALDKLESVYKACGEVLSILRTFR